MSSSYIPKKTSVFCKLDQRVPLACECDSRKCPTCGFNPEVNRERRKLIRILASRGMLRKEWGKKNE